MSERAEGFRRNIRPVAFAGAIDAVGPPQPTVAAHVIGLVVRDSSGTDGALAGDEFGFLAFLQAGTAGDFVE